MGQSLVVISPGEKVTLADGIPATVTGIVIRRGGIVRYEVVWWDGRQRREGWVEGFEVTRQEGGDTSRIGFLD